MPRVKIISSDEEFPLALGQAGEALVVVDFTATWCGPCRSIGPVFERLSDKYPTVVFLKVDVDVCQTVRTVMHIESLPTFVFLKNAQKVHQFSGADATQLERTIDQILAGAGPGAAAEAADNCGVPGQKLLNEYIDKSGSECLNQDSKHPMEAIFTDSDNFLESDCDEQLIVSLAFKQAVKIHSLRFSAPADGRGPKTIRIFANRPSTLDFDEAASLEPVQTLTLTTADLAEEKAVALRFVKFQNITKLTLFIQDNHGGTDTTALRKLDIIGGLREASDMAEFKRVAGKAGEVDH